MYWVETFNHQLLTYLPKRIHFSTQTFLMRMNLSLLDWVSLMHDAPIRTLDAWVVAVLFENVGRENTSTRKITDLRRPDHHAAMKALVKKRSSLWYHYGLIM